MALPIPLECHVCCKSFSGPVPAQQHFISQEHKKKLDVVKQETTGKQLFSTPEPPEPPEPPVPPEPPESPEPPEPKVLGATCFICNISCNTLKILAQHNQSPRHLANAEKQRQLEQFGNRLTTGALDYTEMYGGQSEAYKFSAISNRGWCFICSISLSSVSHAQSHINGKAHKKRLAQFEAMKASGSAVNQPGNLAFQKPASVSQSDFQRGTNVIRPTAEHIPIQNFHASSAAQPSTFLKCDTCGVTFTGECNAQQHYSSEKHKKKANRLSQSLENKANYSCSLCNVVFTGPENEEIHKLSQKHLKNVKLLEKRERGEELPLSCSACNCTFTGQECAEAHFQSTKHKRNMENFNIRLCGLNGDPDKVIYLTPTTSLAADKGDDTSLLIKPMARQPEAVSATIQGDSSQFTRIDSSEVFSNRDDLNWTSGQEVRSNNCDNLESNNAFLTKPAQQTELSSGSQSQEESLLVKPIENDEYSLAIKPLETSPFTESRQSDDESLDIKPTETNEATLNSFTDEWKIKAETYTSMEQSVNSLILNGDTEPVKFVRNDLGPSVGRGRGIFGLLMQKQEKLPGKVVNTDVCHKDTLLDHKGIGASETTMKTSVWEGTRAAPQSELQVVNSMFEESSRYESRPNSSDKFLGNKDIIFPNNENRRDDVPVNSNESHGMEEYVFDTVTGRGRCNICDIDFTSNNHKNQHILGKNHLKAREVRKEMAYAGPEINTSLVCDICSVTFSGYEAKEQHMASEKHKRKEMRHLTGEENDLFCDICKISCTGPDNLLQHKMGAQHRKMAGILSPDDSGILASNFDRTKWFHCEICKCSMNTNEQLKIHEKSPRHLKQVEKQLSSGLQTAIGDRTQWYPCHVCNCSMNTYEQLKTHEKSPRHLKQLEKQKATGNMLTNDCTVWYPCYVCNCSLNSQEQLRIHEASPGHISKLKSQLITQTGPCNMPLTPISESRPIQDSVKVTPLESFLSEELFPEIFLPKDDSTADETNTTKLINDFEEKLVLTDKPFYIPERFAQVTDNKMDIDPSEYACGTGGTKRGQGSDLAWATRNRGTRENDYKKTSPLSFPSEEYDLQSTQPKQAGLASKICTSQGPTTIANTSNTDPMMNNPYAATHPYYCHTCKSPMNTKESYESHLKGKRHMQKVCTEPAPQRNHYLPQCFPAGYLPFTQTHPRNYQQELYKKAMEGDTLCFLPTGTGKTLVATMTISAMLEKYPSKNVLFLVDKVLLVLQQSKYIDKQIRNKEYIRFNPDSDTCLDIVRRTPRIASVCMDQQTTHGIPLWKHDIVVVTAAFCKNLLDKEILRWEDFGLVVFDEAHHCEKGHPFNSLLTKYHRCTAPENKPKILGLTASPAGKADVPKTLQMLRGLVVNMGNVCMTIVDEHENVDTLNEYKSNAEMIIRSQVDASDLLEKSLQHELHVYIMYCMIKLYQISNIRYLIDFDSGFSVSMKEAEVRSMANGFLSKQFDLILLSLNMIESKNIDEKVEVSLFRMHVQAVCMALSCLEEGGALIALQELEDMEATNYNFDFARACGMPTAYLQQAVSRKGQGLGGQASRDHGEEATDDVHVKRLIDELTDSGTTPHATNGISLILVKQRRTAHLISCELQKSGRMRQLGLNTTCVVGHGGSGATDKGMNVNQQKRVLEEIKQYKYQVIVATSVAEEGVDLPECERVISLYPPSTVTALVQMRGRARRKNSRFIVLCSSQEEEGKLYDIMQREENMINATRILIEEYRDMDTSNS